MEEKNNLTLENTQKQIEELKRAIEKIQTNELYHERLRVDEIFNRLREVERNTDLNPIKGINWYFISIIWFIATVGIFFIWFYFQFFCSEINVGTLALLCVLLAFLLTTIATILLKVGKLQGIVERKRKK